MTIAELQERMTRRRLTSRELVDKYIDRIETIDQRGPKLNSVIEINPDAEQIARELDRERRATATSAARCTASRSCSRTTSTPPTACRPLPARCALVGDPPSQDATVAARLREAGAVILGKAGLSEWANFRSLPLVERLVGPGRPGQATRTCSTATRAARARAPARPRRPTCARRRIGTETDGSIVCPAGANGVVGIKPTVGLTSRAGVVPIAASQDTVGPHGRTVADAAAVLGAIASTVADPRDPATAANRDKVFTDYTQFLDPDGLAGRPHRRRPRRRVRLQRGDRRRLRGGDRGDAATPARPSSIPPTSRRSTQINAGAEEITVLLFEFKRDLNAYLATRTGVPINTLADAIAFNEAHADVELQWFLQELFELGRVGALHRGRVPGRAGRGTPASAGRTASTPCSPSTTSTPSSPPPGRRRGRPISSTATTSSGPARGRRRWPATR